jgi:hypothetical protein
MTVIFKFIVSVKSGHCDYFHPDAKRSSYATDCNADKCDMPACLRFSYGNRGAIAAQYNGGIQVTVIYIEVYFRIQ